MAHKISLEYGAIVLRSIERARGNEAELGPKPGQVLVRHKARPSIRVKRVEGGYSISIGRSRYWGASIEDALREAELALKRERAARKAARRKAGL